MPNIVELLDAIPLWGLYIATIAMAWLAYEVGFQLGKRPKAAIDKTAEAPVASIVGAILGLLAFMLAFTFGLAANRFEQRRQLVSDEANAIRTTYLRAGYLAGPQSSTIRNLLREYVSVRLKGNTLEEIKKGIEQSIGLQDNLWEQAEAVAKQNMNSEMVSLFIESLNEVISIHEKRVMAGIWTRIPGAIWITLYLLTFIGMGVMGYHSGVDRSREIIIHLSLIFAFSTVVMLVADLDRPMKEGFLNVSQQPLIEVQKKIGQDGSKS